jgi:gliding motility-associated-like protein
MRLFTFLFLLFISTINIAVAQPPCSGPGRTAQTAIVVCGILTFSQPVVPSCTGPDLPPSGCNDPVTSSNSVWYRFHCYQSGTLGFLITPASVADDYDWELMDFTGFSPAAVYSTNLGISLNLSAITGSTGCTPAGTLNLNCAGGAPGSQYNRMPNLIAGHDYLLMVTNWSNSGFGYNLDFVGGTAVLTDNLLPSITNVGIVGCNTSLLKVNFSEDILCSSLTPLGTEFTITGGTHTITGITSVCSSVNAFTELTLALQNPIPAGNYRLTVNNGTDGNTLLDVCQEFMPVGSFFDFTVPAIIPLVIDTITYPGCVPSILNVTFTQPLWCSSVTSSGSEFSILPGNPAIVSVQSSCTSGSIFTDQLQIVLQNPLAPGNYQLVVNAGTDGNTFIDTCNNSMIAGSTFPFVIATGPSANFNSQVNWGCVQDTIVLSHPGGNGINSWRWNFSDGSTASGQTVSRIYPVTTASVDVELIVTNGFCSDTTTQTITLGNVFNAGFFNNPADSFCINTPVNFTDTSSGNIVNYLWDFGDLTQFNGRNPPTHFYSIVNNYPVQLIVTDNHGCRDTADKILYVSASAAIDFTGLKSQYCTGNQVLLTRKISRNIISYVWDNGDGKTFTNEVDVNFSYANEGVYTITLNGIDRYCGPTSVSKTVPVYAVPKVNLGPDTVLCQSDRMLIGVTPNNNYTYQWNTGATAPQIYTDIFTRDYTLTADNHGCRGYDAMDIKVLPVCLIKVPGAFTPNGDGLNDMLKALNAELAKDFSLRVYNRLGQLIFSTNNQLDGWDGKFRGNPESTGTFIWYLSYTDPWTGKAVKEKGTSVLLR